MSWAWWRFAVNGLQKVASSSAAAALRGTDAGLAADETVIEMRAPCAEVIIHTQDLRPMMRGSGSYAFTLEDRETSRAAWN